MEKVAAAELDPPRGARAPARWTRLLADAIRDPDELCAALGLPEDILPAARRAGEKFGLLVPRGYVERMTRGDPNDPLLRQVLPLGAELDEDPRFVADPLRESEAQRFRGVLQKYAGRVLLVLTGACAVHCRYCFRREYPYQSSPRGIEAWAPSLAEIAADPTIEEVLLSGGDPLVLSDEWLAGLAARLDEIPHLRRLRLHTRLPIVLPERIEASLIDWLSRSRLSPIVVVHANHPRELSEPVQEALGRLVRAGILVLNQSVLLKGVNDDADTLAELSRRLLDARVVPYYLHQLDRVRGAAHFEVDETRGRMLVEELRRRLPGYAVPRYVREIPGEPQKTPLL